MRKLALSGAITVAIVGPAHAIEFGIVRHLQVGPIGDSPQYAELEKYEAEAAIGMKRSYGEVEINSDSDQKVEGSALRTRVVAGGGLSLNKRLSLTASLDVTLASDADEEQTRAAKKSTLDTGNYQHELSFMSVYRTDPIFFGGGIGVRMIGTETREYKYDGAKYTSEIGSAVMPTLRLFAGVESKEAAASLGLRLFSKDDAEVSARDPAGTTYTYDVTRRSPGEIHADGKLKFSKEFEAAASIAYVLTGQASEDVDEFSTKYDVAGTKKTRRVAGETRNANHFRLGIGSKYQPNKMVALLAGISYIGASYAEESYASLEHENLGGVRLDLGTDVLIDKFRGFLHAGYAFESRAKYEVKDTKRGADSVDRTQRAPVAKDDDVKVSQASWDVIAGAGIEI